MDPKIVSLISTNHPPTDAEVQQLRAFLALTDGNLVNQNAPLKAVLSPLRRFPPEILGEFFQWCCENSLASKCYSILDPMEAPILLGHVCTSWRTVSHNSPRLWDTISYRSDTTPSDSLVPYVSTLVAKSRNLPLALEIISRRITHSPLFTHPSAADLISAFPQTLNKLRLDLDARGCDFNVLPSGTYYPMLSTIIIEITDCQIAQDMRRPDVASILRHFREAPCLQHLTLDAPRLTGNILEVEFPWKGLTSLDLSVSMDIFTARMLLTQCTHLTVCAMQEVGSFADHEPDLPISPLSLPRLEFLDLEGWRRSSLSEASIAQRDLLLNFHHRSGFSLTHLHLCFLDLSGDDLIPFLRVTPLLTELALTYCVDNRIVEAFTYNPSTKCTEVVLPLLESLRLRDSTDELDGDIVAGMTESLWQTSNTHPPIFPFLERIHLGLEGRFSDDVEARLDKICSVGFLVDYLSPRF
ncbi:hypothetical protein FB451DRAFT_1397925 [Mycena latifolia]|nr:hypothetical protein FB451DRAFT_1397925 [Mycena latifolia]